MAVVFLLLWIYGAVGLAALFALYNLLGSETAARLPLPGFIVPIALSACAAFLYFGRRIGVRDRHALLDLLREALEARVLSSG